VGLWLLEELGLVTILVLTVAVLATLTLIFFALHKIKPESFTFRASVLKLISLDLEIRLADQKRLQSRRTKKLPSRGNVRRR
jgi:hypothetical protein